MGSEALKVEQWIVDQLQGDPSTHPEQHGVVGPMVQRLVNKGWKRGQIIFGRREWRVPKSPSEASKREKGRSYAGFPVDIAVMEKEGSTDYHDLVFAFECKRENETSGLEQLDIYLGLEPHLKLGVWANSAAAGAKGVYLYRGADGRIHPQRRIVDEIPGPDDVIDRDYRALTGRDLIVPTMDVLTRALKDLLDRVVASDTRVNRREDQLDQLCNVILLKLNSDKAAKLMPGSPVTFRPAATPTATAEQLRDQFGRFVDRFPDIFVSEIERVLRFSDATLAAIVDDLAPLNLLGVGPDVLSVAFQVLRSAALKQKEGQYFTPQPVIAAAVRAVDLASAERILDPACGTGGFLVESMVVKEEQVISAGGDPTEVIRWAQLALHGIDKDAIAIKLTKAVMQIMGDGSAHCARGDSVSTHLWATEFDHLRQNFRDGSFDLIFTNPPFGAPLKVSRATATRAKLSIADELKAGEPLELGLAMLNRCHQLLREGGRLCIVLPETYFFSSSYDYVRRWCSRHFAPELVINVAMEAFAGFCRAKTNVYVFRKLKAFDGVKDAGKRQALIDEQLAEVDASFVTMLNPRTCGVYKNGMTRYRVNADGQRTTVVDNEMLEHVEAYNMGDTPPGMVRVTVAETRARDVLVPSYYDERRDAAFEALKDRMGFVEVTLGDLIDEGLLLMRAGHGASSNDQRIGGVPYVKVSDIRAMRVNVNPTNMIPLALAKKIWGRTGESGLEPWDLVSPSRASSNIGEFAVLLPGETRIVMTKEMFVLRVTDAGSEFFDPFYLMWALSLKAVREQWRRLTLMQTNREDVGHRYKELRLPWPTSRQWADDVSATFRTYFTGIADAKTRFISDLQSGDEEYIGSIYLESDPEAVEAAQLDDGVVTSAELLEGPAGPVEDVE